MHPDGSKSERALAEMCVAVPSETVAAATEIFNRLARMCLSGLAGGRWITEG